MFTETTLSFGFSALSRHAAAGWLTGWLVYRFWLSGCICVWLVYGFCTAGLWSLYGWSGRGACSLRLATVRLCRLSRAWHAPRLCRQPLNLGLGRGLSVLELLGHFHRVTGVLVAHRMADRRYGDVPTLVCDGSRGQRELNWTPKYDIDDMCEYCPPLLDTACPR